jgi:flagellar biosynthetic protein FliO
MKKLIILLMAAASFVLFSQDQSDGAVGADKEYTSIDETSLTFSAPNEVGDGEGETNLTETLDGASITTSDYFRIVFFLIIVIVLVWLFIKLLRRYSGNRFGDQDLINLMGSQALTGDTSLHVVEVENSYYLLGASQTNISLITEITEQETIDALKLKRSASFDRQGKSFFEMLTGLTSGKAKPGEDASEESVDFIQRQRDRLRDL